MLITAMAMICGLVFTLNRSADALHGVVNCLVLAITLYSCILLKRIPPLLLSDYLISATYTLYITHFKVLEFMLSEWGYISFWSWALVAVVVTFIITSQRILLKI